MQSALVARYTFPEFVVGRCNEAAYTAASAAAVAPGKLYNPILITGATGLGKTHLAHAVAVEAAMRGDRQAVLVSADDFLRRLSNATALGAHAEVIAEMSSVALVIIDDVHVLDRHAAAQDALATLASLAVANGSQLLLTSDTASGADALSLRLVRRFRTAHIATLGNPDWEHRVTILHAKARMHGVDLPPSVAHHVAAQSAGSVRELEGMLTRLLAFAELEQAPVTPSLAMRAVPTRQRAATDIVGPQIVQHAVAAEWGVSPDALTGAGRTRHVSQPRRHAMLLCRDVLDLSLREIGAAFGDRDVSTVLSAVGRARDEIGGEPALAERVTRVRALLPPEMLKCRDACPLPLAQDEGIMAPSRP